MNIDPFQVVRDFEKALCAYTGARFAVTTTSCTDALKLAVAWHLRWPHEGGEKYQDPTITIPKRTYVGVPQAIIHAGGRPAYVDWNWVGAYRLQPLPIWDSARLFTSGMCDPGAEEIRVVGARNEANGTGFYVGEQRLKLAGEMVCVSFHWTKTLGLGQGGAILHHDEAADKWLRMARFDGREEGVAPKDQKHWILGHHCYMSPETAAQGLVRLRALPRHNAPIPADEYPDLSTIEAFRG